LAADDSSSSPSGLPDALRIAVERTLSLAGRSARAGSTAAAGERGSELLDELARRGREARAELARRGGEARGELSRRLAARDELTRRLDSLERRLESIEELLRSNYKGKPQV
jgi:polyhydroxyalkanoate synthesis regulator phasin